jgi:hypothetical protein
VVLVLLLRGNHEAKSSSEERKCAVGYCFKILTPQARRVDTRSVGALFVHEVAPQQLMNETPSNQPLSYWQRSDLIRFA